MPIEKIHHVCVCCGSRLPEYLSRATLIQSGWALEQADGSYVFRCPVHSDAEVLAMIGARPAFVRASK